MDKQESYKPKEVDYNKRANIALGVGVFAVIFLPIAFTQLPGLVDFTETGQIGDTIGGVTAPFVGLVGAMLVYYSFKQQMIANNIQVESIKDMKKDNIDSHLINIINEQTNKCLELINSINVELSNYGSLTQIYRGVTAFDMFYAKSHQNKGVSANFVIDNDSEVLFLNVNNYIHLLLDHIDMISSVDVKKIYLRLYYNQIHKVVYSKFKCDSISESDKYFKIWDSALCNQNHYTFSLNNI